MNFDADEMWVEASADHEAADHQRSLVTARTALVGVWPVLASAEDESDFDNRIALLNEQISAVASGEMREAVIASWREDWALMKRAADEPDWDALSDGRAVGDDLEEFKRGYYDALDGASFLGEPDDNMAYDSGYMAGQNAAGQHSAGRFMDFMKADDETAAKMYQEDEAKDEARKQKFKENHPHLDNMMHNMPAAGSLHTALEYCGEAGPNGQVCHGLAGHSGAHNFVTEQQGGRSQGSLEHTALDYCGESGPNGTVCHGLAGHSGAHNFVTEQQGGRSQGSLHTADLVGDVMKWESGEMDQDEEDEFFQGLIDSGMAWKLQGVYGRTATDLIDAGRCHYPQTSFPHGTTTGSRRPFVREADVLDDIPPMPGDPTKNITCPACGSTGTVTRGHTSPMDPGGEYFRCSKCGNGWNTNIALDNAGLIFDDIHSKATLHEAKTYECSSCGRSADYSKPKRICPWCSAPMHPKKSTLHIASDLTDAVDKAYANGGSGMSVGDKVGDYTVDAVNEQTVEFSSPDSHTSVQIPFVDSQGNKLDSAPKTSAISWPWEGRDPFVGSSHRTTAKKDDDADDKVEKKPDDWFANLIADKGKKKSSQHMASDDWTQTWDWAKTVWGADDYSMNRFFSAVSSVIAEREGFEELGSSDVWHLTIDDVRYAKSQGVTDRAGLIKVVLDSEQIAPTELRNFNASLHHAAADIPPELVKDATEGAEGRGHHIGPFLTEIHGPSLQPGVEAVCKDCGMVVNIIPGYSYEIFGDAVAMNCPGPNTPHTAAKDPMDSNPFAPGNGMQMPDPTPPVQEPDAAAVPNTPPTTTRPRGGNSGGDSVQQGFASLRPVAVDSSDWPHCAQCDKVMTPADAMVNPVCMDCAKKNHKQVAGSMHTANGAAVLIEEKPFKPSVQNMEGIV